MGVVEDCAHTHEAMLVRIQPQKIYRFDRGREDGKMARGQNGID